MKVNHPRAIMEVDGRCFKQHLLGCSAHLEAMQKGTTKSVGVEQAMLTYLDLD